ncbi:DUF6468 domain-containing protein [Oceanibaculum indicum]|uniref:DUF6468 domain-containing protein n=1 Tax=Oceanibaculum indicum TaxID=526216 RepID=A0A420WNV6_9PROT|nr:DUF6468 domain-containing protein [Oceanibaculum indicum]RKQ72693.1 hypothetical protein BCL74_0461 [Oceanibaculum indicum]
MMGLEMSLLLETLVAALLVATIVYAAILNRKLGRLRADRAELEAQIARFVECTHRAEASIKHLKAVSEEAGRSLQQPIDRAMAVRDELVFMIERGDTLSEKLSGRISAAREPRPEETPAAMPRRARPAAPVQDRAQPASAQDRMAGPAPEEDEDMAGRSKAERDLLRALREAR